MTGVSNNRFPRAIALLACAFACALALSAGMAGAPRAEAAQQAEAGSARASDVGAAADAANPARAESRAKLFAFGNDGDTYRKNRLKKTTKHDVTGDGVADTVRFFLSPKSARAKGLATKFTIEVNGSVAYESSTKSAYIDQASVQLITLRNAQPVLFASTYSDNGSADQAILLYEGGAFARVADNGLLNRKGSSNAHITSVQPSGNRLIVQFDFVSTVTGVSRTSFSYDYVGGSLQRTSDATSALRFATTATGAFTKQPRAARVKFAAYADASLSEKAFTVKAGEKVRPMGIKLSGDGLVYKISCDKGNAWIACPAPKSIKGDRLLKGTYGRVKLKNKPLAYVSRRVLGLATLQRLSNHALFLLRNEVYARHGYVFSNNELKTYFKSKTWYTPKSSAAVKLGRIEAKNVALALSIERNRKSPYVM